MGRLFGTDGVRGIANETLTCELAMRIGRAAAAVLCDGRRRRSIFVIGTDTRMSSDMLSAAITAGLCSVGADVILLGVIPTPAVAYLVGKYKADAGIMISASHNPAPFNGIKIFSGDGYKLPDALEEQVEAMVLGDVPMPQACEGREVGRVTYGKSAVKDYVEHLKSTCPYSLSGLRIAVDCANGSASVTAKKLFSELGADVRMLFDRPDGLNINDGCGSTHMEALTEYVLKNGLDLGVAFDGDADRCLCVDDKGMLIDGDFIMAICALDMKERGKLSKDTVVGTIMTNFGFTKFCEESGIRFVATKVGDRFVLEEMLLEEYSFGGEQSGHVIFLDDNTTGDGLLSALHLLQVMVETKKKLSELAQIMEVLPQALVNAKVPNHKKESYMEYSEIAEAIGELEKKFAGEGRVLIRPSGTEPLVRVMIEGKNQEVIQQEAKQLADLITKVML